MRTERHTFCEYQRHVSTGSISKPWLCVWFNKLLCWNVGTAPSICVWIFVQRNTIAVYQYLLRTFFSFLFFSLFFCFGRFFYLIPRSWHSTITVSVKEIYMYIAVQILKQFGLMPFTLIYQPLIKCLLFDALFSSIHSSFFWLLMTLTKLTMLFFLKFIWFLFSGCFVSSHNISGADSFSGLFISHRFDVSNNKK